ncbi:NADH-quinone oxidoreductase subunit N [bacterium]|nr:NADH-quinone oxidoreductase subunit N [bacterium]MBU1985325.1 NADH-quinone oxidoreductase subunit N [bacterium]
MSSGGWNVDLSPFLPELLFVGGFLVLVVLNLIFRRRRGTASAIAGVIILAAVAVSAALGDEKIGLYLFGSVVQDGVTVFFRLFFCGAAAISLGLLLFSFPEDGEPFLLVLAGVLGMFLLAGAGDLVTLFVALEVVSIPSYVLAGYRRRDVRSAEAALKYVLYGAFSSGIMLFGLSIFYGVTGETSLQGIAIALSGGTGQEAALLVATILVLAGIGYKIAMVPMHFWCPDVYEGSPTAVTAFLSVLPKAAGFAALFRLMSIFVPVRTWFGVDAVLLFTLASALTMTFGNLGAIWQNSLKRLLAYSSIAHAGYILMAFAVLASDPSRELYRDATTAILFYLVVYLFMNLGAFFIVDFVERRKGGETIEHFRGLGRTDVIPALLLAVFLFSLTGLPPLAGFVGKFLLFAALVEAKMFALVIIGIANTVVSLYYYVRVIREMYLQDPVPELETDSVSHVKMKGLAVVLALATVVPTLVLGIWWGPLAVWIGARIW